MKITRLEACTCVVPLETGMSIATRTIQERHFTLVKVRTDSGAEGLGFCYGGHKAGHLVTLAIRDLLRDVVVGRDLHQVEAIWDSMYRETLLHGRRGSVLRAISAVDIALWDAASRKAGLPLHRYLGGYREDTVPAYASGGYYAEGKGPGELAEEMRRYMDMGLRAVKMKVGRASTGEDVKRIRAAREAIGPDVPLFLDANNAWADSVSAIRSFEESDPGWIEEPLMPDDYEGHAAIAAAVRTPVATGEIHATRWDFLELVRQRSASVLQPDAAVCGGITEWRKIAAMAEAHGIPVAPHWLAELPVHLVASTPNASWVEYFTDFSVINLGRLFTTSLEVRPGGIALPQRPGLGIELDEAAVNRYSVDGWA